MSIICDSSSRFAYHHLVAGYLNFHASPSWNMVAFAEYKYTAGYFISNLRRIGSYRKDLTYFFSLIPFPE